MLTPIRKHPHEDCISGIQKPAFQACQQPNPCKPYSRPALRRVKARCTAHRGAVRIILAPSESTRRAGIASTEALRHSSFRLLDKYRAPLNARSSKILEVLTCTLQSSPQHHFCARPGSSSIHHPEKAGQRQVGHMRSTLSGTSRSLCTLLICSCHYKLLGATLCGFRGLGMVNTEACTFRDMCLRGRRSTFAR